MRMPRLPGGPTLRVLRLAAAVALPGAVCFFHVWSHTQVTAAGYDLARLQAEQRRLVNERDRLRLEVATLRAPGRLERYARTRLGMAPPAPGAVVASRAGTGTVGGSGRAGGEESHRPAPAEPSDAIALRERGPGSSGNN